MNEKHFNGKPCRKCGNTTRYISNKVCVTCSAKHSRKYREKNLKHTVKEADEIKREILVHEEYQRIHASLKVAQDETFRILNEVWKEYSGHSPINTKYFRSMLVRFTPGEIEYAIKVTASMIAVGRVEVERGGAVKYMWGVLKGTRKNENEMNKMFEPKGTRDAN